METEIKFKELIELVEKTGQLARSYFATNDTLNEQKADGSVVTKVDQETENILVDYIRSNFPDDSIVGEEGEGHVGDSEFVWHIDPIDGTDNFLRKIPFCAISVARLGNTAEDSFGVVYNPITDQTFSTFMDGGVYENEQVHELNDEMLGGRAIISIGTSREEWMKTAKYNLIKALSLRFGRGTALNCVALELAYVAANRIDGVLILGLNSYDYAAGLCLIKAGGGKISVFSDGVWSEWTESLKALCKEHGKTIFASHSGIHEDALKLVGDPRNWTD